MILDSSVECLTQRRRESESAENARNLANTMNYASNLLEAKHHLKGVRKNSPPTAVFRMIHLREKKEEKNQKMKEERIPLPPPRECARENWINPAESKYRVYFSLDGFMQHFTVYTFNNRADHFCAIMCIMDTPP